MRGAQGELRHLARVRRAAPTKVFGFVSAPIDTPTLSPFPSCPFFACSIGGNYIGAEGASVLAAILKETQITTLGYKPPP